MLLPPGPIPARTGQPNARHDGIGHLGAYPRSHGATPLAEIYAVLVKGLSPLARGNRACSLRRYFLKGPIPARTGQPQ